MLWCRALLYLYVCIYLCSCLYPHLIQYLRVFSKRIEIYIYNMQKAKGVYFFSQTFLTSFFVLFLRQNQLLFSLSLSLRFRNGGLFVSDNNKRLFRCACMHAWWNTQSKLKPIQFESEMSLLTCKSVELNWVQFFFLDEMNWIQFFQRLSMFPNGPINTQESSCIWVLFFS